MNQAQADKLISDLMDMTGESEDYGPWNTVKALIQDAVTPDKPEAGETVRVRIAVAVNSAGGWAANSYRDVEGKRKKGRETECVTHFVEADIPLPTSVTVKGEVVSDATDNAIVRGHDD